VLHYNGHDLFFTEGHVRYRGHGLFYTGGHVCYRGRGLFYTGGHVCYRAAAASSSLEVMCAATATAHFFTGGHTIERIMTTLRYIHSMTVYP
jgi:hypothetical protein